MNEEMIKLVKECDSIDSHDFEEWASSINPVAWVNPKQSVLFMEKHRSVEFKSQPTMKLENETKKNFKSEGDAFWRFKREKSGSQKNLIKPKKQTLEKDKILAHKNYLSEPRRGPDYGRIPSVVIMAKLLK